MCINVQFITVNNVLRHDVTITEIIVQNRSVVYQFSYVLFQMYSFLYDEEERWAVWPNDISLSQFTDGGSDGPNIVVSLIFKQLMDGVRDLINELKEDIQNAKALLTSTMDTVLATFEDYRAEAVTNEAFARPDIFLHGDNTSYYLYSLAMIKYIYLFYSFNYHRVSFK